MKAIRAHETGGPDVLRFEDVPDPAPDAGELLIDIDAAGINFIDIYQREGLYQVPRPFTLGAEAAGVVPIGRLRRHGLPRRRPSCFTIREGSVRRVRARPR